MALYGQDGFLLGDPSQAVAWMSSTSSTALKDLAFKLSSRRDADLPIVRSSVDSWVRDCSRTPNIGDFQPLPVLPGEPAPSRQTRGTDAYKPPQVGAKDHGTVRDRLQYQARGLHLPYVRSASYDQKVQTNRWTRADLRAHDDPYKLTSGNGVTLNQDGIWTFMIKTDWSIGHAEVVGSAAQATRLMVNGSDVGLRDYLDDDAYSANTPINTFVWTDEFRAGTRINIDVRSEGIGDNYTALCNVYLRAYLVRCYDGVFDMAGFPLPADPSPKPPTVPNPPMGGYCGPYDHQPTQPQYPNQCDGSTDPGVVGGIVNSNGQLGMYKCINHAWTLQWSSYYWDGGYPYDGGPTGSSYGSPGRPTYYGTW